ncbi:hypothetical protein DF268_00210 [Streptomyces sp. V2]|uniref:hypothetical protein n=1 Tax=Streptomyces TaxID=1883 RepID=UPI0006EB981C|nr:MULTISPECIES: hypothetical protein [Streptomyces]PWG15276.1 hypothetical protein DF268_00210 [Streptomyces sp. V2]QZZ25603.1 hypothetical protein A7X85_04360 [Streptomyces sp. ST1015]
MTHLHIRNQAGRHYDGLAEQLTAIGDEVLPPGDQDIAELHTWIRSATNTASTSSPTSPRSQAH